MTTEAEKPKLAREEILLRTILDFQEGWLVNLGSGLPSYIANYCSPERNVVFHAENGVVGMGRMATREEVNLNLTNALAQHILLVPGASIVDHVDSFALVRSGRLSATVMGAYHVASNRDFANVSRDLNVGGSGGGAMDMARNAQRVFIVMEHVSSEGHPKLLRRCTLPLTCPGVVTRVFTDLGVFDFGEDYFVIKEIAPGWTVDEVRALSEGDIVAAPDLKEIDLKALHEAIASDG